MCSCRGTDRAGFTHANSPSRSPRRTCSCSSCRGCGSRIVVEFRILHVGNGKGDLLLHCSRRSCGPTVSAHLAFQHEHGPQDVHDHRDGLLATRTHQSGLVNVVHRLLAVCASPLRRGPDMTALRTAPTEVRLGIPSKGVDQDGVCAAALQAAITRWFFSVVFVELRPVRHGTCRSIPIPSLTFGTERQYG